MPAQQILSCHMTHNTNFKNVLFCPNYTFNIRKSYTISGGKSPLLQTLSAKNLIGGGGKQPPPPVPGLINFLCEWRLLGTKIQ